MLSDCLAADDWPERIRIFAIGYGAEVDETLLTRMANRTGQYYVTDTDNIAAIFAQLGGE